jgi:hypothetical protein
LRDIFADMRMLAYDTGLMNPLSRLLWRICEINGTLSGRAATSAPGGRISQLTDSAVARPR